MNKTEHYNDNLVSFNNVSVTLSGNVILQDIYASVPRESWTAVVVSENISHKEVSVGSLLSSAQNADEETIIGPNFGPSPASSIPAIIMSALY